MIYCTSYESPDLDGVACSIAYAEYLTSIGKPAKAIYFNGLSEETKFFGEMFGKLPVEEKDGKYSPQDSIILLDTADPTALDPKLPIDQVSEIIDHHLVVYVEKFPNAKSTIDRVGSCATLIWEILKKNQFSPSELARTLLFGAIVSNTINFKNKVTTNRDKTAAEEIKSSLKLPDDFVKQMFSYKSRVDKNNLIDILEHDLYIKDFGKVRLAVSQIEVTDLEKLVNELKPLIIKFLKEIISREKLDYALFTGIDIFEGFNILITADEKSDEFFSGVLELDKIGGYYKTKEILMRKEIWPKIKL